MNRLKIENMGEDVQGIRLYGDPQKQPEPIHVRVVFPGGDVDVVRTTDNDYWVHVRVNQEEDLLTLDDAVIGHISDARLDIDGLSTSEVDTGDFDNPGLYHLAVRVNHS